MLFEPSAHEALTDEPWSAGRARAAVRAIVAELEESFADGWAGHPLDGDEGRRLRTIYAGGAGVVDALRRLGERGFAEVGPEHVSYLERSLEAEPDFPDPGAERSLWMGEVGIRLVLQRLAPSAENLACLARADRGQRAGRAPGADVGQPRHDPRRP